MLRICERKGRLTHMQAITLKKEIFVSIVCEIERTYIVCADYILPHLDEPRRIRLIGPSV